MKVKNLVESVKNGDIVLPDFQRSFIWEPEDVRELLVSVLGNYFIGSMLILEHFRDDSPFALRLVEGVKRVNEGAKISPIVKILLDGQQRTTALFYALYEPDINLKYRKNPYKFYLDIGKALSENWDDAVIALNVADKRRFREVNNKKDIIPFRLFRDIAKLVERFKDDPWLGKIIELVNSFMNYEIHMISLPKDTDLEKIVETFERINRTGKPLSIFELLTARLFKHGINLREILSATQKKYEFVKFVNPEFILKVIVLIRGKEPKRRNILGLDAERFEEDWEKACQSLEYAVKRVTDIKNGYGVLDIRKWMPYSTMLVPLAVMIYFLKANKLESPENYRKIDSWYWISVFSNRYDQAVDTTSAADVTTLKRWFNDNDKIPDFVREFDAGTVDLNVEKQTSAIYRAVINLIVLAGALDFKTGNPPQFEKEKIQDDHIFPKSIYNCNLVTNKTLISTNTEKSNKLPSEYFKELLTKHGEKELKKILTSHLIPEDALSSLLEDNLESFVNKRKKAITDTIKEKSQFIL